MKIYMLFVIAFLQLPPSKGEQQLCIAMENITTKEVTMVMKKFRLALLTPESHSLYTLTHPLLSYGHSAGLIENQSEFISSLTSGKFRFRALRFEGMTISTCGQTAIVRHILTGESADRDKSPGLINLHVVLVWQKQNGKIQLLTRQAVKI